MTKRTYIDFESRSQCDIWTSGAWVYSQHPTTEILCLCYAENNDPVLFHNFHAHKIPVDYLREYFKKLVEEGAEFHAHNAYFERSMWSNILVPKYGFTPIPIRQWRCTAAKASAHALPKSLEKCADALECKHRKNMAGAAIMKKLAKSTGAISIEDMAKEIAYCKDDVECEREIDQRLPDLDPREQRVWFLDQFINDTGVAIDREACEVAVKCVALETERLTKELQTISGGEINAGTQRDAIKNFLAKKGVVLADLTKKTVTEAITKTDGDLQKILSLRQQLSLTSNAKYQAFLDCCSRDGRVRDTLVYHGASTGRWSGKLVQLHNLVKPKDQDFDNQGPIGILKACGYEAMSLFYGDQLLNVLSSCIRGMLTPSDGYEMFITDFAAIEARVVMWLAGEEKGLEIFHRQDKGDKDADIYVHMARAIYGKPSLTKANKSERQVGKQAVLGCGFGMGAPKFQGTCDKYGIDVSDELAERSVQGYRSTFRKVVQFWYATELAAKNAIRGHATQCGKTLWYLDGEFLRVKLPVGRTLAYHRPKIEGDKLTFMSADPVTKRYVPEQTWGGKLVENCLAKDTLVLTMRGWLPIIDVKKGDEVWDGNTWVPTEGCLGKGVKEVGWLEGIRVTPDHKILVGDSWKKAIDLDEDTWQEALKRGQNSVYSGFGHPAKVTTEQQFADVNVAKRLVSEHDPFSEAMWKTVPNVVIPEELKSGENTTGSCLPRFYPSGFIGTRAWFQDAITSGVRRIRTTAAAVSKSLIFGLKTVGHFWSTRKAFLHGAKGVSTWTESTIAWDISRGTYASWKEKQIHAIAEIVRLWYTKESDYTLWSFGKSFALFGKATTLLFGILNKAEHPKKLWTYIGERTEVYDLLNCGPNSRFTIMSAEGPIIVHNCTQAVARDLMVDSMFNFASSGFRILLTVHDELVLEAPVGTKTEEDVLKIVRTVPSWAQGCPVNAECEKVTRYKK